MEKSTPTFGNPANSEEASFDYVKLPKLRQLSRKINSRIPLEQGRTSTNNIEDFLLKMTKHSFKSKKFVQSAVPPGSQPSNNKLSVIDPKKSRARKYDSCVINNEGVFIHVAQLSANNSDVYHSIFNILSSFTYASSVPKRILTACPNSVEEDDEDDDPIEVDTIDLRFCVIERKPDGRELCVESVRGRYILRRDIDHHIAEKRSLEVGKPCWIAHTPSNKRTRDEEKTLVSNKRVYKQSCE
tara:strand:- start:539 stop:1264 length:726 start_codon:yes stop_codon:yes gene_type:complete